MFPKLKDLITQKQNIRQNPQIEWTYTKIKLHCQIIKALQIIAIVWLSKLTTFLFIPIIISFDNRATSTTLIDHNTHTLEYHAYGEQNLCCVWS